MIMKTGASLRVRAVLLTRLMKVRGESVNKEFIASVIGSTSLLLSVLTSALFMFPNSERIFDSDYFVRFFSLPQCALFVIQHKYRYWGFSLNTNNMCFILASLIRAHQLNVFSVRL